MSTGPSIIIADLNGSNTVTLTGVSAPYPIPRLQSAYGVETSIMRDGASGAGLRVAQISGKDISHSDLEFQVAYLTSAMITSLQTKYDTSPAVAVKVTLNGGTTWYRCVFQSNGFVAENWTQNYTKQGGVIRFHVIGVI